MPEATARWRIWAALGAVYLIWGSTYLAIRIAIETMPPFLMAGTRFLIAGLILYVAVRPLTDEAITWRHGRTAFVLGGLMLVGGNGMVTWAEQHVASGLAALMVATVPLFLVLHGWAWGGTGRPTGRTVVGLAVGFAGVAILVGPSLAGFGTLHVGGLLALLVAPIAWSAGSIYSRSANAPGSPWLGVALEMIAGGLLLLLLAVATGEGSRLDPGAISARSLWAMGYLIVAGSIIALTAYIWLLKVEDPALVGTYAYVNPVVAMALGWALANEPITATTLAAAAAILAGVMLITTERAGTAVDPEPPLEEPPVTDTTEVLG